MNKQREGKYFPKTLALFGTHILGRKGNKKKKKKVEGFLFLLRREKNLAKVEEKFNMSLENI